jgi:spore coat polysaccharide biosynthesis protein SpsF (cytidylyltransferase family)
MVEVHVLIAIQARSTSARFPMKVQESISGETMLEHVIKACNGSAKYIQDFTRKQKMRVDVALLVPTGDPLIEPMRRRVRIVEGPEQDVLSRYRMALDQLKPDYVVRVTGDCPLLPAFVISKLINTAVMGRYDYISNVDPRYRTAPDGHDCEVISADLLKHMDETAKEPQEREHVTWAARNSPPAWARIGAVVGFTDFSRTKLSVDTPEDLERVRAEHERVEALLKQARKAYGHSHVHRL